MIRAGAPLRRSIGLQILGGAGLVLLGLGSCTFGDLSGYSSGGPSGPDAGEGDATVPDASTPIEAGTDGSSSSGADGASVDAHTEGCAGTAGPKMVRVTAPSGSYCIDSTEVTAAQYAQFVAAGVPVSSQPAECAFNTSFAPKKDVAADQLPARHVNWCDARAYCAWAGKRLCGAVGGGPNLYDNPNLTTEEWFTACSANNTKTYPYGPTYDGSRCSGMEAGDVLVFAGSKTGCEGGFPGLFDMSGNVREWQDACKSELTGGTETCVTRGGASDDPAAMLACGARATDPRNYTTAHLGFRCCSNAE